MVGTAGGRWPCGAQVEKTVNLYDVLDQVVALLQRRGKVTYNALKLQFNLDDEQLAIVKDELLYAHAQVVDDAGRGLMWVRDSTANQAQAPPATRPIPQPLYRPQGAAPPIAPRPDEAERRQLTVLFCDLANSTRLAR